MRCAKALGPNCGGSNYKSGYCTTPKKTPDNPDIVVDSEDSGTFWFRALGSGFGRDLGSKALLLPL